MMQSSETFSQACNDRKCRTCFAPAHINNNIKQEQICVAPLVSESLK